MSSWDHILTIQNINAAFKRNPSSCPQNPDGFPGGGGGGEGGGLREEVRTATGRVNWNSRLNQKGMLIIGGTPTRA